METTFWLNNVLVVLVAFVPYFLGIVIRKKAMPGPNSPPLGKQLLLGVPVSLVVLPPMIPVLAKTMADWSILATCGLIMEQGMILNETATAQLTRLASGAKAT